MIYRITKSDKVIKGTIHLTTSKSESNRVLIIQALCKKPFAIHNLAKAKDTQTLQHLLELAKKGGPATLDVGPAGTTMRFLTAYLSICGGEFVLTGSQRMQERPIGILVDALKAIGADIDYVEKPGFPPLKIRSTQPEGNAVSIDGSVSSQFITALLLIAPCLPKGLQLTFEGEVASRPYIEMTLKIMDYFGVKSEWNGATIRVNKQEYIAKDYTIEADWSAASYWFEIAALADEVDLTVTGLNQISLQGDAAIATIMSSFGVQVRYLSNGIHLQKSSQAKDNFQYDFSDCPDIAQTIAVTAAGLNIKAELAGLASLKIKETDRVNALIQELAKSGVKAVEELENILTVHPSDSFKRSPAPIATYEDHRMAMAFAPLAIVSDYIDIEHPGVVEKSYPAYWEDLKSVGFQITEC